MTTAAMTPIAEIANAMRVELPVEVVLVDFASIIHPIWHLASNDPNPNATAEQSVARVRAIASGQPHVAICLDTPPYFRHEIDPAYKANRKQENRAVLYHQMALAVEILRADGFPIWAAKGFEADDVIAAATAKLLDTGDLVSVLIVSGDKDLFQLVCDRVRVKSLASGTVYDEAGVVAKFGVRPDQVRDYLSLVGDASDGIKGADKIGEKTAPLYLQEFGSLDAVFEAITSGTTPTITPAKVSALLELKSRIATVRELITLRLDAPVDVAPVFLERVPAPPATVADDLRDVFEPFYTDRANGDVVDTDTGEVMESVIEGTVTETPPASQAPPVASSPAPAAPPASGTIPSSRTGEGSAAPAPSPSASQTAGALVPTEVLPAPPAEWERQLEPRSLGQADKLAQAMFRSRLFSAYGTPEGCFATILAGRELGLNAMASLRAFHIVEGKPTLAADTLRALVLKSGKAEYFRCVERSNERVTFATKRKGETDEMRLTYSITDATTAGVNKKGSGWEKHPADMLTARASSKLARLVYPDVVAGLYSPEELSDRSIGEVA